MEVLKKRIKDNYHYIVSALAVIGIAFVAFNSTNPPLFNNLDNFVLFAQEEIKLEQGVQVSSGDLGSNEKIDIEKDAIVNSNLFADEITINKNTQINGNASFNKLKLHKETKILGTQTKPVSLPIANLPEIPEFQTGTQDFKFEGENNILPAGNYRDIILEKNSRLILNGGTYNLRKLELKENSILIFNSLTILNIQFKLKGQQHIAILSGDNNLKPTDLVVNYIGIRSKNEKVEKEDDDDEINALHNETENKDYKERKIGRPIVFGKESFLNFKLLAPKASVKIGEDSTLRGQILARKVKVEKNSILSSDIALSLQPKLEDLVKTEEGEILVVNQIILQLTANGTFEDALVIANSINGNIVGVVQSINLYQIAVHTTTIDELNNLIQQIKNQQNSKIINITKNIIINLNQ